MSFETLFRVLACSPIIPSSSQEAAHLEDILAEVKQLGLGVVETSTVADAVMAI